jgi:hypothetical protein
LSAVDPKLNETDRTAQTLPTTYSDSFTNDDDNDDTIHVIELTEATDGDDGMLRLGGRLYLSRRQLGMCAAAFLWFVRW